MVSLMLLFHIRNRPPPPDAFGGTAWVLSRLSQSKVLVIIAELFLVSQRKKISGEFCRLISFKRWTVVGFPNPQQFQLSTTKDPGVEETEIRFLLGDSRDELYRRVRCTIQIYCPWSWCSSLALCTSFCWSLLNLLPSRGYSRSPWWVLYLRDVSFLWARSSQNIRSNYNWF